MAGVGMREQGVVRPKMIAGLLLLSMVLPLVPTVEATTVVGGGAGIAFDTVPISAGDYHTCAISIDNVEQCWGYGNYGRLGDGANTNRWTPSEVNMPAGRNITSLAAGHEQTCGIMDNGFLYCWGLNSNYNLGDGTSSQRHSPQLVSLPVQRRAVSVSTDYSHTCAILDDRSLWCWGSDSYGALSYNSQSNSQQPFPVKSETPETKVRAVSTGRYFTCIISHNYEVWCTGENGNGQLGDSSSTDRELFVRTAFPSGSKMVAIESGEYHSCTISDVGKVYCWGNGGNGRLGDGNTTSRTSPVSVSMIAANRSAVSLTMSEYYTCALLDDGNVTCWGLSAGNGIGVSPTFPAQRTAVAIAAGRQHMCAVLDDGQVVCWGHQDQIGNNQAFGASSTPTNPTGLGTNTTATGSRDMDGDGFENVLDNCHDGSSSWTSNPTTDHDNDGCEDATEDIDDDEVKRFKEDFGIKFYKGDRGLHKTQILRFRNEPVRHKTLDLIGDLALLGKPILGHITAIKSGHKGNVEFAKLLRKAFKDLNF